MTGAFAFSGGGNNANDAVRLWDGVSVANKTGLSGSLPNPLNNASVFTSTGCLSFWVKPPSGNYNSELFGSMQTNTDRRGVSCVLTQSRIEWDFQNTNDNSIINIAGQKAKFAYSLAANQWNHLIFSWNLGSTPYIEMWIKPFGSSFQYERITDNNGGQFNPLFERGYFNINCASLNPLIADQAVIELYDVWLGEYLDLSGAGGLGNRRRFINDNGTPVKLSSSGELLGVGNPRVFLGGNFNNWRKNKGNVIFGQLNNELSRTSPANFTKSPNKPL
jgi:hypothetical protein